MIDTETKARAWQWAAEILEAEAYNRLAEGRSDWTDDAADHICKVIAPSLHRKGERIRSRKRPVR